MTNDLWRLLVLLAIAVWLAAHDHRLQDSDPIIWDAPAPTGEVEDWLTRQTSSPVTGSQPPAK